MINFFFVFSGESLASGLLEGKFLQYLRLARIFAIMYTMLLLLTKSRSFLIISLEGEENLPNRRIVQYFH